MVKKVLMSLTLVVIILVVVMALTKPDSTAHYDEVKRFAMKNKFRKNMPCRRRWRLRIR